MLADSIHFINHPGHKTSLNCTLHLNLGTLLCAAEVLDEDMIDLHPMTLMWKVTSTFDDSYQRILTSFCTLNDRFQLVVWVFVTGNYDARTSKNKI